MTSTKTTASVFRPVLFFVLGLALSAFGVFHSVNAYPGPGVFVRFTDELPMLGVVASFAIGIAAVLAGLVLLVPSFLRLRRRRQPPQAQPPVLPVSRSPYADRGVSNSWPGPVRRDEGYDFDPEGYEADEFDGGTGSGYGGAYGGNGGHGVQGSLHQDNGDYDQRRRAGTRR